MPEFIEYPKTTRLYSPIVITEKIDGTQAAIIIDDLGKEIYAQSRKKIVVPGDDNFGFASWVETNKETLLSDLGPGEHYGEWWGLGINRNYGMKHKVFSIFNTRHFEGVEFKTPLLQVVPILYSGEFSEKAVTDSCDLLKTKGSVANPGFMKPEGVCVFWSHNNMVLKVPFDK